MKSPDRRTSSSARGYTYRWQKSRDAYLCDHPFCTMCSTDARPVPAVVVDHIEAPRLKDAKESADPARIKAAWKLFWNQANWQPLCKFCHDSTKQRMEKSGTVIGCTDAGLPLDPNHHWYRP